MCQIYTKGVNMKIGIIGAGHPFIHQYQALKDLGFEVILCDKVLSKIAEYPEEKITDYKELVGHVDVVLISTPPSTHKEIIDYFAKYQVPIISEKPLVTKKEDLHFLNDINNFYNIFHFAYGLEITWFKEHLGNFGTIEKIIGYINDPYIENNHIRAESLSLHGAYLDETINPISALSKIFEIYPKYLNSSLKYLDGDTFDYASTATYQFGKIEATINVKWNATGNRDKYIDIYYEDKVIRLDSMNQQVINLTTKDILYQGSGVRMYNHYYHGFKDYLQNKSNIKDAYYINASILDYQ